MEQKLKNWTERALLEENENRPFLLKYKIETGIIYAYSSSRCVGVYHDFEPTMRELNEYLSYLSANFFTVKKLSRDGLIIGFEAKYKPPRHEKDISFHEER